ncbi:MAG TPA: hypothetical protein VHX37_13015 [Acidobacteriaceae bacterium]|jgi:hypothetical protein|nr:hypothetical protein [Acidobacteriaceae bacterium]
MFSHLPEDRDGLRQLQEMLQRDSRDSFQLLKNPWDNPTCSISIDEANRCIVAVWKQYAPQLQLRYIHENMLALIREHALCKLLGDDTALLTIPSEDRFWIIDDWFPRAVESGLRLAASKAPQLYFGKVSVNHIQSSAPPALSCRSFERLEEAREWLEAVPAG